MGSSDFPHERTWTLTDHGTGESEAQSFVQSVKELRAWLAQQE